MKLSPTQRQILTDALEAEREWKHLAGVAVHQFFQDCVYARNLRGLIRIGAVEQDLKQYYFITPAGREAML